MQEDRATGAVSHKYQHDHAMKAVTGDERIDSKKHLHKSLHQFIHEILFYDFDLCFFVLL